MKTAHMTPKLGLESKSEQSHSPERLWFPTWRQLLR